MIRLDNAHFDKPGLHLPTALAAAEFATDAYLSFADQAARIPEEFRATNLDAGSGIEGAIITGRHRDRPLVVIAIRGSEMTAGDWARNLAASVYPVVWREIRPGHRAKMHRGYRDAVYTLWPSILRAIYRLDYREAVYVVTGHSQGGGIAEGIADRLLSHIQRARVRLYTFGAPPVWAKDHGQVCRRYRILYDDDAVPASRLPWPLPGAYHVNVPADSALSRYIWGAYLLDSDTGRITGMSSAHASLIHGGRVAANVLKPWRWFGRIRGKIVSHRMDGYRDALRVLAEGVRGDE